MALLRSLGSILRNLAGRRRADEDLDSEVRAHLELLTEEKLREGASPAEARRTARIELGGVEQVKEEVRAARAGVWLEQLGQDLLYAGRQLRRNPGFAAIAILTLALGVGANTAIFSVVNSVLLRPLAYPQPDQLYLVREIVPQWSKFDPSLAANIPNYQIWRKQVHSFQDVAIARSTSAILSGAGEPELIRGVRSSANLLDLLGVRPALGRSFRAEEDEPGRGHTVLLTDAFWRSRFHADPSMIGRTLFLDGEAHQVIGILPASFHFPTVGVVEGFVRSEARQDFFIPLNGPKSYEQDLMGEFDFTAVARLAPGITPQSALAELNTVQAQIAQQAQAGVDLRAQIYPLEERVVGPARKGLVFLLAAVGAVLLIVCANLAGLLLARVPSRMREAAVRRALGATGRRLTQQLLTESLLLSCAGGALGLWVASLAVKWFVQFAPIGVPRLEEVRMDSRVLGFSLFLTVLTGALFGALPAWRLTRAQPYEALKGGSLAFSQTRRVRRSRETLVGLEVALSTVLLVLAGLLTASLVQLLNVETGFVAGHVLAAQVDLPPQSYEQASTRLQFYHRVVEGVRALPGVREAGWVSLMPLSGEGSVSGIGLPGKERIPEENPSANYRPASPGYFRAMGISLLQGRIFTEADRGRKLVVVSKNVADRFWPGKNPIGQLCVTRWEGAVESEVIGVVEDIRTVRLEDAPLLMVYVPDWFNSISVPASGSIIVRTEMDPRGAAAALRALIHRVDAGVPIVALRPMAQIVSESVAPRRFQMLLVLSFAVSSLLLASLGIFGVVAYSVEQRRHELGIRLALGAQPGALRDTVVREGMFPVMLGLSGGILAALLAGRLIRSLLFGADAFDPLVFATTALVIGCVALAACYLPARRAALVDPMVALRHE